MSALMTRSGALPIPAAWAPPSDRRPLLGVERPPLTIRVLSPTSLAEHAAAIDALAKRALVRNVFYESAFLVHAAHHLRDGGKPQIVTIWRGAEGGSLVGLFPLVAPRFGLTAGKARGWVSHFMPDGTPLIDASCAAEVLCAFLASLAEGDAPAAGILFPCIDVDGPFAVLLRSLVAREDLTFATFDARQRAVLRRDPAAASQSPLSAKKRKEIQRQERRLGEVGRIETRSATDRSSVRDAFEHFLAIEARGWKGRAGSAMMQDPSAAAFSRSAMRALAAEGRCRIDLIELDGEPISATIELSAGDRRYFWKTAYDEKFARFSPGVQSALKLTHRHAQSAGVGLVDSCAEADHPMIDRLWADRMNVADLFVGASAARRGEANGIVRRERLRRRARAAAKRIYRRLRPL